MPVDNYQVSRTVETTARRAVAVTPHDVNALSEVPKCLFIGTTGNVTARLIEDTVDTVYKNLPNGSYLLIQAQYVRATGTTAADIVALY